MLLGAPLKSYKNQYNVELRRIKKVMQCIFYKVGHSPLYKKWGKPNFILAYKSDISNNLWE